MRREQIAAVVDDFAYAELDFERQQKLIDAILALDAVTQTDSCPLRGDKHPHYETWMCQAFGYWCNSAHPLNHCKHFPLIQKDREAYHASRCRECQRPEEAYIQGKRDYASTYEQM